MYAGFANIISDNLYFKVILWIISGFILLFLGISSILSLKKENIKESNTNLSDKRLPTFISGILITLTNPVTIVGWLAIAGNFFLIWNDKFPESKKFAFITIILIVAGVMLWFLPLTFIVSKLKKVINKKLQNYLIIFSNIILIIFGIIAFYYALKNMFSL